jgi:integrase
LSGTVMRKMLALMGHPDLTVHGFRSSFKDWASKCTQFPREWIEISLAHTVGNAMERAYWRDDLVEERRRLMAAWADYCAGKTSVVGIVTPMRAAGE